MAKAVYETIKIAFQNANFKIQGGVGFDFQAMNQQPAVNILEKCIEYGAPLVALYVAGRLLQHSWSWINPSNAKSEDELGVSVNSDQVQAFQELAESGKLSRQIQHGFDDIEGSLKVILGEKVLGEVGQKALKLIGGVRVKSVEINEPNLPKNMKAKNIVLGDVKQENYNTHDIMAVGKNVEGTMAVNYAGPSAKLNQVIHGGGITMTVGLEGEDLKNIMDTHKELASNLIQVKIIVIKPDGTEKPFERKFKPNQTIRDVIMALEREENDLYYIYQGEQKLDRGLTLAQAAQVGSVVNWEARK